jgi:hypothetical protein
MRTGLSYDYRTVSPSPQMLGEIDKQEEMVTQTPENNDPVFRAHLSPD